MEHLGFWYHYQYIPAIHLKILMFYPLMTCKSLVPKVILFSQYWIACHHRIHGQTCDEINQHFPLLMDGGRGGSSFSICRELGKHFVEENRIPPQVILQDEYRQKKNKGVWFLNLLQSKLRHTDAQHLFCIFLICPIILHTAPYPVISVPYYSQHPWKDSRKLICLVLSWEPEVLQTMGTSPTLPPCHQEFGSQQVPLQ